MTLRSLRVELEYEGNHLIEKFETRYIRYDLDLSSYGLGRLNFPHLTHAIFETCAISSVDWIPYFCEAAPNLILLSVYCPKFYLPTEGPYKFPQTLLPKRVTKNTLIRQLRINLFIPELYRPKNHTDTYETITSLVEHSPLLKELSLALPVGSGVTIREAVYKLRAIETFHWEDEQYDDLEFLNGKQGEDLCLVARRILTEYIGWKLPVSTRLHVPYWTS